MPRKYKTPAQTQSGHEAPDEEAERRLCQLSQSTYLRVRGKRRNARGRSGWSKATKSKEVLDMLVEAKGKRRREEVDARMRALDAAESSMQCLNDGSMVVFEPVPSWAERRLRPGEWREPSYEGTVHSGPAHVGNVPVRYYSRAKRLRAIYSNAGLVSSQRDGRTHWEFVGGAARLRFEERDNSGVT